MSVIVDRGQQKEVIWLGAVLTLQWFIPQLFIGEQDGSKSCCSVPAVEYDCISRTVSFCAYYVW